MPPVFCMSEFVDHTIFGARAEPLFGILVEGIGVRPSQQVESAGNRLDAPTRAPRSGWVISALPILCGTRIE